MKLNFATSARIISLAIALSIPSLCQSGAKPPLQVYVDPVDTNIKEFSGITSAVASDLSKALSSRPHFFTVVDPDSASHDTAVVRSELLDTADGAILRVTIKKPGVILWQDDTRQTRAQWQLADTQSRETDKLIKTAAKKLWPGDPANNEPPPHTTRAAATTVTPENIARGIEMAMSGEGMTSKELEQASYDRINSFLESQRRSQQTMKDTMDRISAQRQQAQHVSITAIQDRSAAVAASTNGSIDRYHSIGLYRRVVNTLDALKGNSPQAARLETMNEQLKTLDDIQNLADALKPYPDAYTHQTYTKMLDFIDTERRLSARMQARQDAAALHPLPVPPPVTMPDPEQQTVSTYRSVYASMISKNLDILRARKVPVDHLAKLNSEANSVADIQKLADEFKNLAGAP